MRKRLAAILAAVFVAVPASAATTATLVKREHRQQKLLWRHEGTVRFFHRHPWLLKHGRNQRIARRELRRSSVWVQVLRRELAETRAARQRRELASSWLYHAFLCIHRYEGAE